MVNFFYLDVFLKDIPHLFLLRAVDKIYGCLKDVVPDSEP